MPLLSKTEVLRIKLSTIPVDHLRDLAQMKGKSNELIKKIIASNITEEVVDTFIKKLYKGKVKIRQSTISDESLLSELNKVQQFQWGVVQGQLDNKIQVQYVRKYHHYENLLKHVKDELYDSIKDYVICTWYNHWTTVILEDLISTHQNVVPTLKNVKGVDFFFEGQPFDLKTTYMPSGYHEIDKALNDPKRLAIWLYENQGAQRFGADNRFFVVVHDRECPTNSWKIKRDINFIKQKVNTFFEKEKISESDEIVFTFQGRTFTAITKVLLIVR